MAFKKLGVDARFAASESVADYEQRIDVNTKAIYCETISNPSYQIPDFDGLSALAKKHDLPLIVDNTFGAGGYLFRPLEHGANVVVESATKWIGGHGTSIGGIIVDGGKGQLSASCDALKALNLYGKVPIIGIAKRLEEIYFPEDSIPLYIDKKSESLKLIQQLGN